MFELFDRVNKHTYKFFFILAELRDYFMLLHGNKDPDSAINKGNNLPV